MFQSEPEAGPSRSAKSNGLGGILGKAKKKRLSDTDLEREDDGEGSALLRRDSVEEGVNGFGHGMVSVARLMPCSIPC